MPSNEWTPSARVVEALTSGDIEVLGRIPWSSNYTFLVSVQHSDTELKAIYKPEEGEQPLGDFPPGLFRREVAAFELASALGWPNIPETVERDGPFGAGSLQRFVEADFEQNYFTIFEQSEEHHEEFFKIAVFDLITNNTDRKAGHCLLSEDGSIWAIDHGLCFSAVPKLRTVIWEFEGQRLPNALLADVTRIAHEIPERVSSLLTPNDMKALQRRLLALVDDPVLPSLVSQRQYPWPLI